MPDQEIEDQTVLNQIALRRYIRGRTSEMLQLFEEYDKRLASLIRSHYRVGFTTSSPEYKDLLRKVKELREEMIQEARELTKSFQMELLPVEDKKEWLLLLSALHLRPSNKPTVSSLARINRIPFSTGSSSAATLDQWYKDLQSADLKRIRDSLNLAVVNEDSLTDLVARTIGTKTASFRDGAVARSRHNVAALTVTVLTHLSHHTREHIWVRTPQVRGSTWTSILDTLTSDICISRDNKVVMYNGSVPEGYVLLHPPGARPPAHPNCRSAMVAFSLAPPDRRTFHQFFTGLRSKTQNKVLGKRKAELFRNGDIELDDFVDATGAEYNIKQLESASTK